MARRRKMTPERKEFINGLLEHYQPTDAQDVQEMLKDLLGDTLQGMLEAEMDQKLGYSKYDYQIRRQMIAGTVTAIKRLHLRWAILILIFPVIAEVNLNHRL